MSKWIRSGINVEGDSEQFVGDTREWQQGENVSAAAETPNSYDFRAQTISNFQEPEEPEWTPEQGGEAPRAWDIHYTPSWFVEEQTNRKNPMYQKDETWSDETVDAIANYVSGWKKEKPQEWRYGDPGWDTSTQLWRENIKPVEDEYRSVQSQTQAVQQQNTPTQPTPTQPGQQQDNNGGTRFTFYGNNARTTALAIPQGGLNAPIAGQDTVQKLVNNNSRYKWMNIDTSNANYSDLSTSGKINYWGMPSQGGTDVKNAPAMSKYTQSVLSSVMSASGPANIAKLAAVAFGGPVGWVYGGAWLASAGYSYGKSIGLWQGNKVADKFMELTDILDEKGAQAQGALAYGFEKAGGGDITDPSKFFENIKFLGDNFDTVMHYAFGSGKASTEFDSDVVGIVTGFTPNIGANVVGFGQTASRAVRNAISLIDDPEQRVRLERGQTTRNNLGLQGAYDIPEELQGSDALMYWLQFAQDLKNAGVTNEAELEYWVGHYINQVYGDLSNYSEFIEHELGDPGNTVENMQSRGMNMYGKVIGSENLQTAAKANTGNLAMDLAGQIPGAQGLIETIGRAFGKELRSSGGIDEVLGTWDLENLNTTDTSKLTRADRRFSGINEDGTLQSLTPRENPNAVKNPFKKVGDFIGNLFNTTNEYRATLAGDAIFNYIDAGIEDAMSAREGDGATAQVDRLKTFVDEMANPETISPNSPFAQQSKTILFNSVKEDLAQSVRSQRGKIDKAINDYASLEPNRQVLNTLATSLGITPHKLMDMYENNKPQLTQMILNKADQNGGRIPKIDIDVEGREFGDRVIAMLSPFAGKDAKAYDPRGLMLQVSSAIADGVTDTLTGKYSIEQEGFLFRFGDSVKKMQHLWLLGLSPSYLANNLVNNVLTRSAIGWGGYMTPKTINNYMERFGYTPARFQESTVETALDSGDKTKINTDKLRSAIRDRKKSGYKLFDKVDKGSDWVSEHLGFFGKLSGKVEENESRQIFTSATMTYMNRSWKAGVNFRKMDTQLENMIRAQNPDMVDTIYSAISSGINMKEIEQAIFGTYIVPSVQDSLIDAARQMNIENPEDFVTEVFGKAAILDELQQALRGKRGEEIDVIVDRIGERMKYLMQVQLAEELSKRAEAITNNVTNCGFAEAIKLGQDTAEDFGDIWLKSQDMNTQIFDRRISEGLKTAEFRAIYQQHQKDLNERWAAVYARAQQTYVGILRGLGMTTETNQSYMKLMKQRDDLWVNFYQTRQPELFQPYLDALAWRGDDTFETWNARVRKAWKEYSTAMSTEYQNTVKAEADLQKQMDDTFVKGLKKVVDKKYAKLADAKVSLVLEEIRNKRQEIIALNLERRAKADNTSSLNEKKSAYSETDAEIMQLKQDYIDLQKQMYDTIAKFAPVAAQPTEDSVMMDVDHEANIKADIAESKADETKQTAEQFSNTMTDEIAETEAVPDLQSTTPDTWEAELNRKNAYKIAKDLGATDDQAVAYSQLNNVHAKAWNGNHPGKNYYRDGGGMTVRYTDEARTVPVQGADGTLYQVEAIERADVNTPEFEAWHGNNPLNFKDGKPLSVFHGSKAWFDHFRRDLLGSFTQAASAKLGFFFASSKKNSEHYAKNAQSKLDLAETYLVDALNIDLEDIFISSENDIEWVSNNPDIFPNGLKDYIDPNDVLNKAEAIKNEFLNEFGKDADIFEFFTDRIKESKQDYEDFLASIQSGKKNIDADVYEPYFKNLDEYMESYGFERNKYSDPADVTGNVLREIKQEYYKNYDRFLDSGIEIDRVFPVLRNILEELRYPETLSQNDMLNYANELSYYNSILSQLISDTFDLGILSEDEMQLLLTGKELSSENIFGEKRTNADKLRNLESEYFANVLQLDLYSKAINRIFINDDVKENFNRILNTPEDPNVREFYLSFNNPYVVDYKKRNRADVVRYSQAVQYAIDNGYDAVILRNTYDPYLTDIYVVFNENQMKSVYNSGEWSDPMNFYHQEQEQRIKGQFSIKDEQKVIELFQGSDFSSLIHETTHGWATTLNDNQIEALAAYNGWTPERYRQLENQWWYAPDTMSEADRTAWQDAQERFAYGFETYLAEGKAPNSAMAQLFENFKNFLLDIYKSVKAIVYKGEAIDIHKEQHGVTLAEIFDSMLTGEDNFNIDREGLVDVESNSITQEGSYGFTIPESARQFIISESAKLGEKISAIKSTAEESMRMETQLFLDENKKWGLSEEETYELVTEVMHELGLNQELSEDPTLQASIQEKLKRFPGGEKAVQRFIDDHRSTAAKISDSSIEAMLRSKNTSETSEAYKYALYQTATPEQIQKDISDGKFVPFSSADITQMQEGQSREEAVRKLAQQIVDNVDKAFQDEVTTLQASINKLESDQQGLVRNSKEWRTIQKKKLSLERQMEKLQKSEKRRKQFTVDDYIAYINESRTEDGKPVLSDEKRARIYANVSGFGVDPDNSIARSIKNLRAGIDTTENIPTKGTYVVKAYSFDHGGQQIVGAVYHDGILVAYIPKDWKTTQIDYEGTKMPVLGVSVTHPNQWMYMIGDEVHEEPKRVSTGTNPFSPQMEADSMGDIDPTGEIGHKMLYEDILPILSRFEEVYRQNVDNAITGNGKISSLDEKTRSLIRGYIDTDVRQDLMNTKFKAGKFGEMMRDAALLNYSKRYGFDNYLTLLFPYQFWNTRSMWNWINRMGGKGGKLWRRYARLKEMEDRNKKELMPSRNSGKIGFYIPGLPDWMGDALFMPTSQLTVVGNFLDPAIEWMTDDKVFIATAERYVQEAFDEGRISSEEFQTAMDPAKRNGSGVWQEMYARAQSEGKGDRDFGNLFRQYFGMSLPVSIGKAIMTGNPDDWSQTPTTRMGTAWRALFGENIVGRGGQALLAGPEHILRDAVVKATGNEGFKYNEFGSFGDYYIRQQVWDMVVEGRISAEDAVAACAEKENNKVWNEAADRQRDEILQKTQILSATAPMKKIVSDYKNGNTDEIGSDWAYLLSSILTTLQPTTVVRQAERDWRETKAEVGKTYDTNDKKAREAIYEANPNYTYNNLRYETDEEQMLRKYLYKKITDVWYDLDKTEQDELRMAFGPDFQRGVLSKETRAIETMDLDRLAAYAQALNGSIPYLATDKLNTMNVPQINTNIVPQAERDAHRVYLEERERLHPGMADVSKIYYNLPVEDRKTFRNANPKLTAYMEWNTQYKKTHEDAANFLKRQSTYYDMIDAENVIEQLDSLTLKALKAAAYSDGKLDKLYQPVIEQAMYRAGVTDEYKYFIKTLTNYILGE